MNELNAGIPATRPQRVGESGGKPLLPRPSWFLENPGCEWRNLHISCLRLRHFLPCGFSMQTNPLDCY